MKKRELEHEGAFVSCLLVQLPPLSLGFKAQRQFSSVAAVLRFCPKRMS